MDSLLKTMPEIDREKCTGCGECVEQCPVGVVKLVDGKAVVTEECNYCTDCETLCPSGAIACPFDIVLKPKPKTRRTSKRRG